MTSSTQGAVKQRTSDIYLEREGQRLIGRVINAVEHEPWSVTLLQLAWTAGPATFLAAQGGYYLGFGEFLPTDRIIFFVGYTAFAGVIGILTKLLYDQHVRGKRKRREEALTTVIDRLPELIFAVRDLTLASLPPEQRKREAAWRLLKETELGPVGLATAVEDLTGSIHLADTARRMEIYRRQGMFHRARDLFDEEADLIGWAVDALQAGAPAMAGTLRERLEGRGVTVRTGVPRDENFVERIFAAIGDENPALMTLYDVEEVLVLAFELISGREIPVLTFNYRGSWQLARATDALERARVQFQIAKATGYSRLKALIALLTESDVELAETVAGQDSDTLLAKVQASFDQLREAIYDLRVEVANGRISVLDELEDKTRTLAAGIEIYEALRAAYREMGRRHAELIRARGRWDALSSGKRASATELSTGGRRSGLSIAERAIRLDDDEKLRAAEALMQPLRSLDLRRNRRRPAIASHTGMRPLTVESAKDLAVDVALVLERFAEISRPQNQRAINASNAPLLANIEPGMSAATKAAVGSAVVQAIHTDVARPAERLAAALVHHYRIELTDKAIGFLHDVYGADLETLQVIAAYAEPAPVVPVQQLRNRPPSIPPLDDNWTRQVNRGRRLLASHDREL